MYILLFQNLAVVEDKTDGYEDSSEMESSEDEEDSDCQCIGEEHSEKAKPALLGKITEHNIKFSKNKHSPRHANIEIINVDKDIHKDTKENKAIDT